MAQATASQPLLCNMIIAIFDWKRTLYDPDNKTLIEGALELLQELSKYSHIRLVLYGKGGEDMYEETKRLGVNYFFQDIVFKEGKKDPEVFKKYMDRGIFDKTVVIGDRTRSEIEIGNQLGAVTVWIKQGKFASEAPLKRDQEPTFTYQSLTELKNVISLS